MPSLDKLVRRVFRRAWQRYGGPVIAVVRPLAQWALPEGCTYDPTTDVVRCGDDVVGNPEDYWAVDYIYVVPLPQSGDMRILAAAGVVPTGQESFSILPADISTVREAHAIEIDGLWFNVAEVESMPLGATKAWARVGLTRRS